MPRKPAAYERHRDAMAERSRERSSSGREIGPLPPVADPARRERGKPSLRIFCETYLAERFSWPWSPDHLAVLDLLETTVLHGGQYALAMPRGFGKTTLCESAALWAAVYGHRFFIVPIGATLDHGEEIIVSLKTELESNELLLADFPEVCYPIAQLEGIAQRAKGQTLNGQRTRIVWTDSEVRLPAVEGSPASGSIVRAFGLTGSIRGTKATTIDGRVIRPDFVLLDDPQTDESAKSPMQNYDRLRTISGAVLGLAGRKREIAVLMPTTVIYPNDLADQILNRDKHPRWQGQRFKMLYSLPTNKALWEQYADLRRDSLRAGHRGDEATAFYAANRAAMDEGAKPAWPECFKEGELSAIQSAMNFLIDNPRAFAAEGQNEPLAESQLTDLRQLEEADLAAKINNTPRGTVPRECNRLTAFVDIQAEILFWAICGWTDKFGGAIVEYGAYPSQRREIFTASDPAPNLSQRFPGMKQQARIYAGLSELIPQLLTRQFTQPDGVLTVSLCLIDSGFETDTVHDYLSRSPLRALLHASKGRGISASSKPMNEYRRDPGDRVGWNWRIDAKTTGKGRFVSYDTNAWKTFIAEALLAPPGASGSLYLPGSSISSQPLLAQHLLSEYRVPTFGQGRRVEEWKQRPDNRENHWWDCLVGCAVAASMVGVTFTAAGDSEKKQPLKVVKFSDMQKQKNSNR